MNTKFYKSCAVPMCPNTSAKTPQKLFVYVPEDKKMRKKWFRLAKRDKLRTSKAIYFCEDHFDMPNDMENFMEYHLKGSVSRIRMRPKCLPTKFLCQPDRKRTSTNMSRPVAVKRQRKFLIEEIMKDHDKNQVEVPQECDDNYKSDVPPSESSDPQQHNVTTKTDTGVQTERSGIIKSTTNHCAYVNCFHTKYQNQQSRGFKFPNNKERRTTWIKNCGNAELLNVPAHLLTNRYICERHFTDDSFRNSERKTLNFNAVPIKYDIDKQIETGRMSICADDRLALSHENDVSCKNDYVSSNTVRSSVIDNLKVEDNSHENTITNCEETKDSCTGINIKCEVPEFDFTDMPTECEISKAGLENNSQADALDLKPQVGWLMEKTDECLDSNADLKIKCEPFFNLFKDELIIKEEN